MCASSGSARTFDLQAGDVGYVPRAMLFRSDRYEDVSLAQWLGLVPPELVRQHLPIGTRLLRTLPNKKPVVN